MKPWPCWNCRSGSIDKAIARLRQSVELLPNEASLRWTLANMLAERGDVVELRAQIDELRKLNYSARSSSNSSKPISRRIQTTGRRPVRRSLRLQTPFDAASPDLKSRLNILLARCYAHLGDSERQRDAYRRAIAANPEYVPPRLGLASSLASNGELEQAIEEYRRLADQVPQAWSPLVRLLISQNQQRPSGQRDWTEVEKLIQRVKDFSPASSEWVLLRAQLLLAQDKATEAETLLAEARSRSLRDLELWVMSAGALRLQHKYIEAATLLAEARSRSPRDLELWAKAAEILRLQRKYIEAATLLDQAQKIGDSINLRIERALLLVARGGADLSKSLGALAENTDAFPPEDRSRLLQVLAAEITRLNDYPLARKLLLELIDLDRNNLEPHLQLLDLAFRAKNTEDIENQIKEIKQIDGADGPTGRFQEIRYTLWQAENTADPDQKSPGEQKALRSSARLMINDLSSRRPDWPQIPLALAMLDEQELAQTNLDPADRKRKVDEAANHYLRAIELGQRNLQIIRRATDLLYEAGRPTEVTQLWNQLPTETLFRGNLQYQVAAEVLRNRDYSRAIDLAHKATAANPGDYRARLGLVEALLASPDPANHAKAEVELRGAVDAVRSDPDRWLILIRFLAHSRQMEKAESALRDATLALKDKSPVALARCYELVGQAYQLDGRDAQKAKAWYEQATQWYKAARDAKPDDPAPAHQLVEFLLRSGQLKDAEAQLKGILEKNRTKDPKSADELAWARRTLALTLLKYENDYQQSQQALAILEPIAKAADGQGDRGSDDAQSRRSEGPRQGLPSPADEGLPGEGAEDLRGAGRSPRDPPRGPVLTGSDVQQ